MQVVLDI